MPVRSLTGFTLIELLVVLLIIGLFLGFVSCSIDSGSRSRQWLQTTELLARETSLALLEAQSDGRDRGLGLVRVSAGTWSWRWYQQRDGQWLPDDTDPADAAFTAAREFPVAIEAELRVDAKAVELGNRNVDTSLSVPDMVFFASGEMTPFIIRLNDSQSVSSEAIALCGDALGRMQVVRDTNASCDGIVL